MAILNLVVHSRIIIDAPPSAVWPHFLNPDSWRQGVATDYVSGPVDDVGEVRLRRGEHHGQRFEMRVETVVLEPCSRKVVKLWQEDSASPGYTCGALYPLAGSTLVIYDIFAELNSDIVSPQNLVELQAEFTRSNQRRFDEDLRTLKAIVEG